MHTRLCLSYMPRRQVFMDNIFQHDAMPTSMGLQGVQGQCHRQQVYTHVYTPVHIHHRTWRNTLMAVASRTQRCNRCSAKLIIPTRSHSGLRLPSSTKEQEFAKPLSSRRVFTLSKRRCDYSRDTRNSIAIETQIFLSFCHSPHAQLMWHIKFKLTNR